MGSDVKVVITLNKPLGRAGFGTPLIYTVAGEDDGAKAYAECKNLEEIAAAGFAEDSDVYKAAALLMMQENAPAVVAVCSGTGTAVEGLSEIIDKPWRQLLLVGETDVKAVSDYIETKDGKMFFANVKELSSGQVAKGAKRTVLFYYTGDVVCPAAALVGASAGLDVGSFTYKNLILKGLEPLKLSDVEIKAAHDAGALTFVQKAGDNVTTEGKVVSGEYIDIIDSEDYVISQLEYQTQKILNASPKVPYDNKGIAMLEAVAVNVMKDAYNAGIIATTADGNPEYSVDFALREESEETDRAARKYLGGRFSFALAGAVHEVEIKGEIVV